MVSVSRQVQIDQPVEEVQAQFADVAHHEGARVHRAARFAVVAETDDSCRYEQSSGRGPLKLRQTLELDRADPAHLVNTVVAGPLRTGTLTFLIEPRGGAGALVTATLDAPVPMALRWAAPLLRFAFGRSLARAPGRGQGRSGVRELRPAATPRLIGGYARRHGER